MAFNKVILEGNLTRAPELKYTSGKGTPVAKTGIAINRISNVNGERREEVCFVDLTFWGRTAEIANQYLQKGSKVLIEGHLVLEQWQDQNGQNRSKHSVTVETMQMLGSKEGGNNAMQGGFDGGYDDGGYSRNSGYNNSYGANQSYPQNQGYNQNFGNGGANQGYNGGYNQGYQQNTPNQNFGSNNGSFGGGFNQAQNQANPAIQKPAQSVAPKEEKLPEYDVDKDEIPF